MSIASWRLAGFEEDTSRPTHEIGYCTLQYHLLSRPESKVLAPFFGSVAGQYSVVIMVRARPSKVHAANLTLSSSAHLLISNTCSIFLNQQVDMLRPLGSEEGPFTGPSTGPSRRRSGVFSELNRGRKRRIHPLGEYIITLYTNGKLRTRVTVTLISGAEASFIIICLYLYLNFFEGHTLKGVGLCVADSHTGNHREDDFTPPETFEGFSKCF
ncbi:hypothetical protein Tco_0500202 [Tanacetum coccineum]